MRKHNIPTAGIKTLPVLLIAAAALLAAVSLYPGIDLAVSGWFYAPGNGFPLDRQPLFILLHDAATIGSRILGVFLLFALLLTYSRRKALWNIDTKGWAFLLLGLLLAPGLVGNVLFKDHWGRARPHEITAFGGTHEFSPALIPQNEARKNGSFVAGDPAFGFYLSGFGYAVPARRSRRFFWGGMSLGALFGLARIGMGAHFLSDVVFAALFMLATTAALHAAMYGGKATQQRWKKWL